MMSNDNKLKPCPFCGGEARLSTWGWPTITCDSCDLVMHPNDDYKSAEMVIAMWNRRASPWISVKQGLPQERVVVLVIDSMFAKTDEHENRKGYGNMRNPGVRFGYVTSSGFRVEGVNGDSYITHWMPLPELPEK